MVLLGNADQGPYSPVAVWPDAKLSMVHLTRAAERALKERRGLLLESDSAAQAENILPESYHVAYPIEVSKKLHGVVVLEIEQHSKFEIQAVMRQLHWGTAWLEVLIRRTEAVKSEKVNERLQKVLDLVATVVEHDTFYASAMAFVNRLATTLDCDRVSLGVAKGRHVKVGVLSHSTDFGGQTNLMRGLPGSGKSHMARKIAGEMVEKIRAQIAKVAGEKSARAVHAAVRFRITEVRPLIDPKI